MASIIKLNTPLLKEDYHRYTGAQYIVLLYKERKTQMVHSTCIRLVLTCSFFATFFCSTKVFGGFYIGTLHNKGTWQGQNINLDTDMTVNTGKIVAVESIDLTAKEELSGDGLIEAPVIHISVKTFTFTGTINCSKTCVITAETPFDQSMFKREGNGEFIIKIEEKKTASDFIANQLPIAVRACLLKK